MPEENEGMPPAEAAEVEVRTEVAHAVVEATGDPHLAAEVADEVGELAEAKEVADQVEQAVLDTTGDPELAEQAALVAEVETVVADPEPEPVITESAEYKEEGPAELHDVAPVPDVEPVTADTPPRRVHPWFRKIGS